MSEYESPERVGREPTVEDVRELVGPSTPHFAPHIRNRIRSLIVGLPEDHPARVEGEMHIERLERIAFEGERRGPAQEGERELPSVRRPAEAGGSAEGGGSAGGGPDGGSAGGGPDGGSAGGGPDRGSAAGDAGNPAA